MAGVRSQESGVMGQAGVGPWVCPVCHEVVGCVNIGAPVEPCGACQEKTACLNARVLLTPSGREWLASLYTARALASGEMTLVSLGMGEAS